jgi:spore coat protein CotH
MKKVFIHIAIACLGLKAYSQAGSEVFNDTVLHTLYIETDLPDWFATLEQDFKNNLSNPELYPEIYHKCNITWDGIVLNDCGFREKGNASNTLTNFGRKKPFKIAFDEFEDQQLDGLKKINLNNFINDPSLMHDVTCLKLFRDAGLNASRTSYTKLWINGEYIGLYVVIENVDKTFLKSKFGSAFNDGNLYKTDRGASVPLNWLGTSSQGYKDQGLKLTTNETLDDWSKFIGFVDFLNNYTASDFKEQFETRFDVHGYLKALAVEKCVRSWDSYWGGGNNFYLYEHPDGKFRWIPWDMNETFQDIKLLSGTSFLDGYLIPTPQFDKRPLIKRIFEIEDYKKEYLDYVCELIRTNFTLDHLGQFIVDRHDLVKAAYREDPYKTNSYESFESSLTEDHDDEVSFTHSGYVIRLTYPGIFPFIQSQREWVVGQLEAWDRSCPITGKGLYDLKLFPDPASTYVNVSNESGSFEYAQFRLYDFTGKLCRQSGFEIREGSYSTWELPGLAPGMYLLLKQSADGRIGRGKLIIQ